jgi:hypothetical protein
VAERESKSVNYEVHTDEWLPAVTPDDDRVSIAMGVNLPAAFLVQGVLYAMPGGRIATWPSMKVTDALAADDWMEVILAGIDEGARVLKECIRKNVTLAPEKADG